MLEMALVQHCSPQVDPVIANAIVKTESSFRPFAIGVNRANAVRQPTSYAEAVTTAKRLIAEGVNIDLGLAQINSNNLAWLRLSVEQAFDPCANLTAMQTVFSHCYQRAGSTGQGTRLQRAFSCYNTGNMSRGFSNGYVNKTTRNLNEFYGRLRPNALPAHSISSVPTPTTALPDDRRQLAEYAQQLQHTHRATEAVTATEPVRLTASVAASMTESDSSADEEQTKPRVYQAWDIFREF